MADRGFSDLLSSASSLLNSQSHSSNPSQGHASKPSSAQEGTSMPPSSSSSSSSSHAHKPSYDEVLASAQVMMNAAKNTLHKPASSAEGVDYGKLAGAAGTLIGAASHYGKIEETGYGKYAHKAQEYLHSYEIKHGKPGMTVPPSQPSASAGHSQQGQPPSSHRPSEVNISQPSAPPQGYPTGYPPQGYPDAQQGYGHVPQGQSKPAESHANVDNYPPIGYPPAGYPTSGGNYNRPSKYS